MVAHRGLKRNSPTCWLQGLASSPVSFQSQHVRKNNQVCSQKKSEKPTREQQAWVPEGILPSKITASLLLCLSFCFLSGYPFVLCLEVARMPGTSTLDTTAKRNLTLSHTARNQIGSLFMLFKSAETTSNFLLQRFPFLSPSLWQACGEGRCGCGDTFRGGVKTKWRWEKVQGKVSNRSADSASSHSSCWRFAVTARCQRLGSVQSREESMVLVGCLGRGGG